MNRFFRLLAALTLLSSFLAASSRADESWKETFWRDFSSPVTTPAWIPLTLGSGATLYLYALKTEIGDPLQSNWATNKPLGSSSKYGDDLGQMLPNGLYFVGMAIDGWGFKNEKSQKRAILMLKASAYAGGMAAGLKYVFREPRPNGSSDMASFPSGHATDAFAFAAVVGAEHEWYWGALSYGMATFVAASRINDNEHRLHDVFGGATLGMSYGLGLYYRAHQNDEKPRDTVYQLLPTPDLNGAQVAVTHEF